MKKTKGQVLYSAADVLNFLECKHHTTLDLIDLNSPLARTESNSEQALIQNKGKVFEKKYLQKIKGSGLSFFEVDQQGGDTQAKVQATLEAMSSGVEIIYQAHLKNGILFGVADFLRKVPVPSSLGEYSYEVVDTKLSQSTKVNFVIQLAFYSEILSSLQNIEPENMHIVLGDQTEKAYPFRNYSKYLKNLLNRFFESTSAWQKNEIEDTYPDPCDHCSICIWSEICEKRRIKDDHLCQVADITKTQIKKLNAAGITTFEQLGRFDSSVKVSGILPKSLEKICKQAALQLKARQTGKNHWELLPYQDGEKRGFARMPKPSPGDMFFDMEGNPLEEGGLEYLFGVYLFENGKPEFKAFWAHTRSEEKKAFEDFMDFVVLRLKEYPDAHIYHYAHYEATALKKLMSLHGTRESAVDNLLRAGKLIDLYKVVREGLRVSEPAYSIKNLESFYMDKRSGDVQTAVGSIVFYEQWKESGDDSLLQKIEDYNYDDVLSTYLLREWLLSLKPDNVPWPDEIDDSGSTETDIEALNEHEERIEHYRTLMVEPLSEDQSQWTKKDYAKQLTWQMLDFYRRSEKPLWWAYYSRREMDEDELIDDVECIAGITRDSTRDPKVEKRSLRHYFTFPEQETKIKTRDSVACFEDGQGLSNLEVDDEHGLLSFTLGKDKSFDHARFSIGPKGPVNSKVLKEAVFRFADSLIAGNGTYKAIESLLDHEQPRISSLHPGTPIIDQSREILPQMSQAISNLDHSHIFIQGPPGSGKTYSGSRVIVDLLQKGFRVGVSSNSHKAINNLLESVESVAKERGFSFKGAKKSNKQLESTHIKGEFVEDHFDNKKIFNEKYQLLAGTAWLFSRPELDQKLDFLFIDEAGQVALANMVAMGTCAKNIVLLGDQMQLGQPIQGVHPGRSGESTLEYLLDGKPTIPPDKGIFLSTTWRMHPGVNALISDMIYEGRLEPESHNINQKLILESNAHPELLPAGIRYVPVEHDGCSQKSLEEAKVIKELIESLTRQKYQDKDNNIHPLGINNILVVAPYNLQVNLLKSVLPQGARVGTVDKFQGQQAEVVIVSMATSNEEYMPRHIDFLFSKNRLNVAISRAKSLAIVVSNPALMSIKCSQPDQVALVNALCWVKEYSDNLDAS